MSHRIKNDLRILAVSAAVAGCGASQAVGSQASDMSPEGHCAAAERARIQANQERNAATRIPATKPAVENRLRAEHKLRADECARYAGQHEGAAVIASGGNVAPCGPMQSSSY